MTRTTERDIHVALTDLLPRLGGAFFATDAEGRVRVWTPMAHKTVGLGPDQTVGRSWTDLFEGPKRPEEALSKAVRASQSARPPSPFDLAVRTRGEKPRRLGLRVLSVRPTDGDSGATIFQVFQAPSLGKGEAPPPEAGENARPLSRRELEVLKCLAEGTDTKRIAEQLFISQTTIRNHVQNILRKLAVHSKLAAVAYAHRNNLF